LNAPEGVAADSVGNVYVADTGNNAIRKYAPVLTWTQASDVMHGQVAPYAVAVDGAGNVYVADTNNNAIRRYAPDGSGGWTESGVATSGLSAPFGIAVDGAGNVFVADTNNNAIRRYAPDGSGGWTQTDVATSGLSSPYGVAADGSGNVFVADTFNNAIRKYAPDGSGGWTPSTVATSGLAYPRSVAVDGAGHVYVADTNNNAIRRYAPDGSGGWTQSNVATNGLNKPSGIAVDGAGNVSVADTNSHAMRQYAPDGNGGWMESDIATNGLYYPYGIAVDGAGNVYIADSGHNQVVLAVHPASIASSGGDAQSTTVGTAFATPLTVMVTDSFGQPMHDVPVTFASPTSGASTASANAAAATDASGTASLAATANTLSGSYTVTASVDGVATTVSFDLTNTAGAADHFAVGATPTTVALGGTVSVTVTALDAFGNTATDYSGTVTLSSTDTSAALPTAYAFTSADAGVHTFAWVTMNTAGSQTLTATDASLVTGTSGAITVNQAVATITLSGLSATYDGQPHAVTAQTTPAGLAVGITYDGGTTPPANAGSYAIVAAVDDANYTGTQNGNLVIAKAITTLSLSSSCMRSFVESQPFTFKATLSGGVNAGGHINFDDGSAALCSNVNVIGNAATCHATLSAQGQPIATLALGASYTGDANNAASNASPFNVTVLALTEAIFRNGFDDPGDPDACPIE
jgi:streptogramin lyase